MQFQDDGCVKLHFPTIVPTPAALQYDLANPPKDGGDPCPLPPLNLSERETAPTYWECLLCILEHLHLLPCG